MMRFLAEGATLVVGTNLLLQRFSLPLATTALTETSKMCVSSITRVVAAEAIAWGMTPSLSFTNFTRRTSPPDGHFEPAPTHDLEIFAAKQFSSQPPLSTCPKPLRQHLLSISSEPPPKRALDEVHSSPREFEYLVQATVIWNAGEAGFVLHVRVTAHNISSLLFHPRQKPNIILFTLVMQGKVW
jgi:hypothetical protein